MLSWIVRIAFTAIGLLFCSLIVMFAEQALSGEPKFYALFVLAGFGLISVAIALIVYDVWKNA